MKLVMKIMVKCDKWVMVWFYKIYPRNPKVHTTHRSIYIGVGLNENTTILRKRENTILVIIHVRDLVVCWQLDPLGHSKGCPCIWFIVTVVSHAIDSRMTCGIVVLAIFKMVVFSFELTTIYMHTHFTSRFMQTKGLLMEGYVQLQHILFSHNQVTTI